MTNIPSALCGALLIFGAMAPVVAAQHQSIVAGRVPVRVAVTDSTNFGQEIVILRRPDADPPNLILMSRAAATPGHLVAAAATLSAIMQRDGDVPSVPGLFRVSTDATGPSTVIGRAREALARLDAGGNAPVQVTGVGPARTTRIYLPDHAARNHRVRGGRVLLRPTHHAVGGGR